MIDATHANPRDFDQPTAVKLQLCDNHTYRTYMGDCDCETPSPVTRYAVFGTDYGYVHTTTGTMRLWNNPTSAYAMAHNLRPRR